MICKECGCENPNTAQFCKNCGNNIQNDSNENQIQSYESRSKINNGSLYDWILPFLYWHDKRNDEYKLSKTKIISILVFMYLLYQCIFVEKTTLIVGIVRSLILILPVFLVGYFIHYLINR